MLNSTHFNAELGVKNDNFYFLTQASIDAQTGNFDKFSFQVRLNTDRGATSISKSRNLTGDILSSLEKSDSKNHSVIDEIIKRPQSNGVELVSAVQKGFNNNVYNSLYALTLLNASGNLNASSYGHIIGILEKSIGQSVSEAQHILKDDRLTPAQKESFSTTAFLNNPIQRLINESKDESGNLANTITVAKELIKSFAEEAGIKLPR